jgi:LCP family protein required for cell wall assembly
MAEGDKPYTVYRGGRDRGSVPTANEVAAERRPGRERKPRRRRLRIGLLAGGLLLGVVLFLVGWGIAGFVVFEGGVKDAGKRIDAATKGELSGKGGALFSHATTILLIGTDHSDVGGRGGDRHADSMMLVRTDPKHHRIAYLSIPRDLYVEIPAHGRSKINAAYQIGGSALELRTIKQFTGLEIDHVVLVDFGSFRDLIDSIGGVTVNNPTAILSNRFDCPYPAAKCASWKGWSFGKGTITLDGRRALAYSRVRENRLDASDTDFTRNARQQQVVNAVGAKLASISTFFRLPFIGGNLLKPLASDLSAWDILQLGWVRLRSSSEKALHCRLGGDPTTAGGASVILPSEANRETLLMFTGQSAPQPPPPGSSYQPGCTVGAARPAVKTTSK